MPKTKGLTRDQIIEFTGARKARWQVELFFKWSKQNLKVKSFLGASKNAVLTQVWIAMCVYLLLSDIKFLNHIQLRLQQMLRLLQLNFFERRLA